MATQILRTIDRWRFEAPMAVLLAGAAGFAVMAMPHALFGRIPVAGALGRPGQAMLALLAALVLGIAGYLAMRRPAKRIPVEPEDDDIEVLQDFVPSGVNGPVRIRRADRHPDAPAREPIRASRDLGEPFMDVASLVAAARNRVIAIDAVEVDPAEADPVEAEPVEAAPIEREPVEAEAIVPGEAETREQVPAKIDHTIEEAPAQHLEQPVAMAALIEPAVTTPIVEATAPVVEATTPIGTAAVPSRFSFGGIGRREDTSLAAMIDRLSEGMKTRGEATVRKLEPRRDRGPALREALDELNRLAVRRG